MVAAFDYCLHGRGGAAPSIDTAMHGLVDALHVDHLHPDAGIALATAADGEALTKECFGDRVVWVPWRRPGLPARAGHRRGAPGQPARDRGDPRRARHHGLGRAPARSARRNSLEIIRAAQAFLDERGRPEPFGPALPGERRAARRRAARPRGGPRPGHPRPGQHRPARQVGHFADSDAVLDFLAGRGPSPTGRARHVVPGPLPADEGPAAAAGPAADRAAGRRRWRGCGNCTPPTATTTGPTTSGMPARTPRRCAAPTRPSCWFPASACSPSAGTSRPPGSPASSTSTPST